MAKADDTKADPDIKGGSRKPSPKGVTRFDSSVIGTTGLNHGGSGMPMEEYLVELRGAAGRRVFTEMADNCPVSGAVIFALSTLFRGVNITVQAADHSKKSDEGAVFVEEMLDDMEVPVDALMAEIATMFIYGFAPCEILLKRRMGPEQKEPAKRSKYDDNKVALRGLPLRNQKTVTRWKINDDTGAIEGMYQQPWVGTEIFIPFEKLMLFRTTPALNNPEGRSVLRNAYRPWFFKRRIEEIEAIGIERDLAGIPVVRVPSAYMAADAEPDEKAIYAAYVAMARGIRRDTHEGIVLPSDVHEGGKYKFDIDLLSTGGSRSMDTSKSLDRYDRQIAMSVLADFIFLGQSAVGSFALSSDKTAMFAQALDAFLKLVIGEFNNKLLPLIWRLNNWPVETMPKLFAEPVMQADLAALGSFLGSMTSAGAPLFPDRDLENHLRERAGLPPAPEEGTDEDALRMGNGPGVPGQPQVGPDGQPIAQPKPGAPGQQPKPGAPGQQPKPGAPGQQPKPGAPGQQPKPGAPGQQPKPDETPQKQSAPKRGLFGQEEDEALDDERNQA